MVVARPRAPRRAQGPPAGSTTYAVIYQDLRVLRISSLARPPHPSVAEVRNKTLRHMHGIEKINCLQSTHTRRPKGRSRSRTARRCRVQRRAHVMRRDVSFALHRGSPRRRCAIAGASSTTRTIFASVGAGRRHPLTSRRRLHFRWQSRSARWRPLGCHLRPAPWAACRSLSQH